MRRIAELQNAIKGNYVANSKKPLTEKIFLIFP